jgi:hypothetical protein
MIIAIDGPAASGKGTLAKRIAAYFGYACLDTGLLYRAVGRQVALNGGDPDSESDALAATAFPDSLLEDPHLQDVGFFEIKDHPTEGRTRNMRLPNKWSCGTRRDWRPAPKLGEHSVDILHEAGFSADEIKKMIADGVTVDGRIKKQ